jgi:hypothetical protein
MAPGAGSGGAEGVWEDVTESGMTGFGGDDYGMQVIKTHPLDPSIIYVWTDYQGIWRSTDYGMNYVRHSQSGSYPDFGKNWAGDIAPDASYMLAASGNNFQSFGGSDIRLQILRSTDGGVTWGASGGLGVEPYGIEIDKSDPTHAIFSCHDSNKMFESTDSGVTWVDKGSMGGDVSPYVFFINSTTVLCVNQGDNGAGSGTRRGTKSGSTWSWTTVSSQQHWHGSCQIFVDTVNDAIFLPGAAPSGADGIEKSTDGGLTFSQASTQDSGCCIGTPSMLYASKSYPNQGSFGPSLQDAPRNPGTSWTNRSTPSGMAQGAAMYCVTYDGINYIVIFVGRTDGIWRYKEPN